MYLKYLVQFLFLTGPRLIPLSVHFPLSGQLSFENVPQMVSLPHCTSQGAFQTMETRDWLAFKQKRNLSNVTVRTQRIKRKSGGPGRRKACTLKLLGCFAEDATLDSFPQKTCMGSQMPVDVGHHVLDPAALAHLSLCTPDCTPNWPCIFETCTCCLKPSSIFPCHLKENPQFLLSLLPLSSHQTLWPYPMPFPPFSRTCHMGFCLSHITATLILGIMRLE